jgi:antitoxin component YwqK of YwqJK toxin-antitoxin module
VIFVLESNSQTFDTIYSKYGNGIESIGQRLNGRKVGRWIKYDNYNNNVIAGEYFYNSIDSTVLCKNYRHGKLIYTNFSYYLNDSVLVPHGYSQWYDSNFVTDYGSYYKGKPHGKSVSYNPITKSIYEIKHYEYGSLQDSFFLFHDNGQLFEVGLYKNDQRIGIWKEYYENGILAAVGEYLGESQLIDQTKTYRDIEIRTKVDFNLKKGKWSYYSPKGDLIKVEIYDDSGELVGCYKGKQLKKIK